MPLAQEIDKISAAHGRTGLMPEYATMATMAPAALSGDVTAEASARCLRRRGENRKNNRLIYFL